MGLLPLVRRLNILSRFVAGPLSALQGWTISAMFITASNRACFYRSGRVEVQGCSLRRFYIELKEGVNERPSVKLFER